MQAVGEIAAAAEECLQTLLQCLSGNAHAQIAAQRAFANEVAQALLVKLRRIDALLLQRLSR